MRYNAFTSDVCDGYGFFIFFAGLYGRDLRGWRDDTIPAVVWMENRADLQV